MKMKKFLAVLLLVLSLASASHGAVSEDMKDIYVRQDVFDAKMEALFNRFHGEIQALGNEIKGEIKRLEGEIKVLGTRMDSIDKRMTSLETIVTWIFGLLSVVVAAIALTPLLKEIQRPKFTLDDVKLLIEENNAKFNLKSQK